MGLGNYAAEFAGRHWLTSQLLRREINVAVPQIDQGVDLIIFRDSGLAGVRALPLQLKCASGAAFSIDQKYGGRGMPLVHIWNVFDAPVAFIMTHEEALGVFPSAALETPSWINKGSYVTTSPSTQIKDRLQKYRDRWEWLEEKMMGQPSIGAR